ncbi:peroxiredoxin [Chitinophaga skermanii]|uniref:Peroxiredoxin n=1 Tax=Chitinophaga skermanii TaxID=331697 RepID=A0A327QYN9_9BACT|nr:TlpA disulfide reductase family protein [Chitinophaga skermanii]RAJ08878.1 peroxiredoxin [Chitinophaga skermanii]
MKLHHVSVGTLMLILSGMPTVFAQKTFTMKGQMGQDQQGMISLRYTVDNKDVRDSCAVINGTFSFEGKVVEPTFGTLVFIPTDKSINGQYKEFFIDPSTHLETKGTGNLVSTQVKGGESQVDFMQLTEAYLPVAEKGRVLDSMFRVYMEEEDKENAQKVGREMEALRAKRREVQLAFAMSHPNSYVGFSVWLRKVPGFLFEPAPIQSEFAQFSPRIRNSIEGKKLAVRLAAAERLSPGKMAPNFTLKDVDGKDVSLASLKGQNVLLVFWMRNFVPFESFSFAMNKISRACKDENMKILSVYYDTEGRADWKQILDETGMKGDNIINVMDPDKLQVEATNGTVINAYNLSIGGTPHAYLIGADGKIISRNINFMEEPAKQIKALLKN